MTQEQTENETYPVPDEIAGLLTPEELENLRERRGWAVGKAKLVTSQSRATIEPVFVELLNGEGRARPMSGVRYLGVDNIGEVDEGYAWPSTESIDPDVAGTSYYVITEYFDPDDPEFGPEGPEPL